MRTTQGTLRPIFALALVAILAVLSGCSRDESPRTFRSPEEAVEQLQSVLTEGEPTDLEALFGPGSLEHLQSGDPVADAQDREAVIELMRQGVTYEDLDDATKVASFGADAWPFPFPLVAEDGRWRFDVEAGVEELHNRRIGRNELFTLATLHAYVDAQREYRAARPEGVATYAQRFMSEEGTRNGLYWPTAEGEEPSPLGDLLAQAATEGYDLVRGGNAGDDAAGDDAAGDDAPAEDDATVADAETSDAPADGGDDPNAYHGYRYRILTAQGKSAPGGERSYLDDEGRMTLGFAAVAWPASHGNSGIMTFIVNQQGIVFQKDLGPETATLAAAITSYDPDETWMPTGD